MIDAPDQRAGRQGSERKGQPDRQKQAAAFFETDTVHTPHDVYSLNTTAVPGCAQVSSRAASQLVRRTHPCDCTCPMREGCGVP